MTIMQNISQNLALHGLSDLVVTGTIGITADRHEIGGNIVERVPAAPSPLRLSELCAMSSEIRHRILDQRRPLGQGVTYLIDVFQGEDKVGHIETDRRFHYEAAPDLGLCLGWAIVTDLGQNKVLSGLDLRALEGSVKEMIRTAATQPPMTWRDFFFNVWTTFLADQVMVYDRTTRFGDGYCGVANLFWTVGMRTLAAVEHPGFGFAY